MTQKGRDKDFDLPNQFKGTGVPHSFQETLSLLGKGGWLQREKGEENKAGHDAIKTILL